MRNLLFPIFYSEVYSTCASLYFYRIGWDDRLYSFLRLIAMCTFSSLRSLTFWTIQIITAVYDMVLFLRSSSQRNWRSTDASPTQSTWFVPFCSSHPSGRSWNGPRFRVASYRGCSAWPSVFYTTLAIVRVFISFFVCLFYRIARILPMDLCFLWTSEDYCFAMQDSSNSSSRIQ